MGGINRPQSAIPCPIVESRGQRIRRERRLKRLSVKALAAEVGISERTLRSIELDQRPDARTIDLVEAYLDLNDETPPRTQSPPLDQATNAELAFEVYRRLAALDQSGSMEALPEAARSDPEGIAGPPAPGTAQLGEPDTGQP